VNPELLDPQADPEIEPGEDISFFAFFFAEHSGQMMSLSSAFMLLNNSYIAPQLLHWYSYIGMVLSPVVYL